MDIQIRREIKLDYTMNIIIYFFISDAQTDLHWAPNRSAIPRQEDNLFIILSL